jgi:hypothetical protein
MSRQFSCRRRWKDRRERRAVYLLRTDGVARRKGRIRDRLARLGGTDKPGRVIVLGQKARETTTSRATKTAHDSGPSKCLATRSCMTHVLRHSPIPGKDDLLARKRRDRVDALDLRKRVFRGKLDPVARRQHGRSDWEIDTRVHPVVRSPQRVGVRVEELDRVPVYNTGQTASQLEYSHGCRRNIKRRPSDSQP